MKKVICFFSIYLVTASLFAQGTWQKVDLNTNHTLLSVCFTDSLYGWAAGDSGTIFHTVNGGNSWVKQASNINQEINEIFFLNRTTGWASAFNYTTLPYGTIILKTINGGQDWTPHVYADSNIFITCIFYSDSLTGWMGGRPHALVKTTDGGITWHQANVIPSTLSNFPVLGIKFYDRKYGYACGGMFDIAGVIWRTRDGGDNWNAIDPSLAPADEVHALHTFDSLNVMGAGGDPDFGYGVGMIRSNDGGSSWTYHELGLQGYALDLDFRTESEGWAPVANQPRFVYTLDKGVTWMDILTPDSTLVIDVTFPDSLHGYAVGKDGTFLKYKPKVVGLSDHAEFQSNAFQLLQNNPNPFNGMTCFQFIVPPERVSVLDQKYGKLSSFQIKILNLLGKVVGTLNDYNLEPGLHQLYFSPFELPEGIYLFELEGIFNETSIPLTAPKKLILAR